MKNNPLYISINIVGYNTSNTLKESLQSLNNLIITNHMIEVIYIDDGSTDTSLEIFKNYQLKFNKKYFQCNNNQGRMYARNKGIQLASGEWILFINSNIVVDSNLLIEYTESINNNNAYVYAGCMNYLSTDSIFQKYLNQKSRGIKKYKNNQRIHYSNLLLSNSIIKKTIFDVIQLDINLRYYGGAELVFAYKLNKKNPNMMRATKGAVATRINHLNYKEHLSKLIEYGQFNFKHLDKELKLNVVKCNILLTKNILCKSLFNMLYSLCIKGYKIPLISNHIIKLGMVSAILKGYYKTQ